MNLGIKAWILVSLLIFGLPLFPQVSSEGNFRVENVTIELIEISEASDKVSFALELGNQTEVLAAYVRFSGSEQERIANKTVVECEFIIEKELSDFSKTVYANCIVDKATIEVMNSTQQSNTYIGWSIGIAGILIGGVLAYYGIKRKK